LGLIEEQTQVLFLEKQQRALAEKIQLLIDNREEIVEMSRRFGSVKTFSRSADEIMLSYETSPKSEQE
jgi:hypothetical protein